MADNSDCKGLDDDQNSPTQSVKAASRQRRNRQRLNSAFRAENVQRWIYDDFEAKGSSRVVAPRLHPAQRSVAPPGPEGNQACAGCGSKTHVLMRCLQAGPDGLMTGCPKCNTLDHSFAQCVHLRKNGAKLDVLIEGRGNMPAFHDVGTWALIVQAATLTGFKSASGERMGHLNSFPWSPAFTHAMNPQIPYFQAEMDKLGLNAFNGFKLPADPATQDWAAIERTRVHPLGGRIQKLSDNSPGGTGSEQDKEMKDVDWDSLRGMFSASDDPLEN
ncbi:hypothetical protein ACHAPJ_010098 [Fusarium lateritium]